jgi:tetratricopeptide (TPR) repeat protein
LMKETLEKLNFEVILDTNLRTRTDLLNCINLFGEKRKNYSVGFVYYAGHGVQIDGGNYILATKEKYDSKINVKDNGVNVDRFLEYFELAKNEINILILDACRNNPFEKNWTTSSRSLEDGFGLAPLSSSGNIIAFSTSAGTTASDGNEKAKNSSYCLSLVKNMMTPDLDLDQIFRNVRKEVREISGGNQLPTVDNHYEGSDFYFRKSTYTDQIIQIDSLIDEKRYDLALEKVSIILAKSPNNKKALLRRGRIEYNRTIEYNGFHLFKADSLYPNDPEVNQYIARFNWKLGKMKIAHNYIDKSIMIDPNNPELFYWRARIYEDEKETKKAESDYTQSIVLDSTIIRFLNRAQFYNRIENYELALSDYSQAISVDKENPRWYNDRANCYIAKGDFTAALKDLDKAIDLAPNEPDYYNNRADFYRNYKNESDLALKDYAIAIKLSKDSYQSSRAFNNRALIYKDEEKFDLALEEYTKAIEIYPIYSLYYSNRAAIYQKQQNYELALKDYTKAIQIEPQNAHRYYTKGALLENFMNKPYDALVEYSIAISKDSLATYIWWKRGKLFSEKLNNQKLAIEDFNQILKIKPNDINALNWRTIFYDRNNDVENAKIGYQKIISLGDSIKKLDKIIEDYGWANINLAEIYQCEDKIDEAFKLYNEGINYMPEHVKAYYWRAWFFALYLSKYDEAISDFSASIKLEPNNPYWLLNSSKIYHMKGDLKSAKSDMNDAVKISNESPIYIAERGNFYSVTGEFDKATRDFNESIKLDSLNRRTFHYLTENLIRQGKLDEALKNATTTMTKFKNDTISYEQIGRINFSKNELFKSLNAYTQAASIMEFNEGDRTIYPHDIQVFLSDVDIKIAEIYKKLNQSDLQCEFLNKAKEIVIFETRPDRQKMIKEIQEKLKNCQN